MKKLILFILAMVYASMNSSAQSWQAFKSAYNPVRWQYYVKKTGDHTYKVHLAATIKPGWHLYAQKQPESAIAIPTKINFHDQPSIVLEGYPNEVGKRETAIIKSLGIAAFQYTGKVDFVQKIKMQGTMPANISGSITYQVCKEHECLPPKTVEFNIRLKERRDTKLHY